MHIDIQYKTSYIVLVNDKTCSKCGLVKSVSDFYQRKSGKRVGEFYEKCAECMKSRGRQYYHRNHARQLALALKRRRRAYKEKRHFINLSKNKPCVDCGVRYPQYVMDFDHNDSKDKINDVAYMVARNWSLEKIKKEVAKCEVVCANCHRMRTFKRQAEVAKVVTAGL